MSLSVSHILPFLSTLFATTWMQTLRQSLPVNCLPLHAFSLFPLMKEPSILAWHMAIPVRSLKSLESNIGKVVVTDTIHARQVTSLRTLASLLYCGPAPWFIHLLELEAILNVCLSLSLLGLGLTKSPPHFKPTINIFHEGPFPRN